MDRGRRPHHPGGKGPTEYYRVRRDGKFYPNVRTVAELEALGIVLADLEELPEPALDESAEEDYRLEQQDPELTAAGGDWGLAATAGERRTCERIKAVPLSARSLSSRPRKDHRGMTTL